MLTTLPRALFLKRKRNAGRSCRGPGVERQTLQVPSGRQRPGDRKGRGHQLRNTPKQQRKPSWLVWVTWSRAKEEGHVTVHEDDLQGVGQAVPQKKWGGRSQEKEKAARCPDAEYKGLCPLQLWGPWSEAVRPHDAVNSSIR